MKELEIGWTTVKSLLSTIDHPGNIVYGVPNGGMIASAFLKEALVTEDPTEATIILDDIVDSGETAAHYIGAYPRADFFALVDKKLKSPQSLDVDENTWVIFPWERDHPKGLMTVEHNIVRLLQYIGEDATREGLVDTPTRVIKSYEELFAGYSTNPKSLLTTFKDTDEYDQIVLAKDIELFSMCEHHMLPFFGKAHVAYIPGNKVIGVSKLARILDMFARRLQIQERIGQQVTNFLMEELEPVGAACIIEASHLCMRMRGVRKQHSIMVTSSLTGAFKEKSEARNELMQLIGS